MRYGERYGERYGVRYGERYGERYGVRYGVRYGERYGVRYGDCDQKGLSIFFIFEYVKDNIYISTYVSTQKLSPRFLWVSKFDVKFESGGHEFRKYGR